MTQIIKVLIRHSQYNPREFIVKNPQKIATWKMLSQQENMVWNKGRGIRIKILRGETR